MIDLIFVFVMGLLGIGLLKLQKKLMPRTYFYYARLIDGIDEDISWKGSFIRTSIPVFTGLVSGGLAIIFQLLEKPQTYGMIAALVSIFLLVWPDFLNPELISFTYQNKKKKLYSLYIILFFAFGLLGAFGGRIANWIYLYHADIYSYIDFKSIINGLIGMAIWTGSAFLIKNQANSFQSKPNKSDQSGTANRDADGG